MSTTYIFSTFLLFKKLMHNSVIFEIKIKSEVVIIMFNNRFITCIKRESLKEGFRCKQILK